MAIHPKTSPQTTMPPLLPGGYTRSALVVGPESPRLTSGSGYTVTDRHGRTLIDLNNDFSALVHGNAHPAIVAAAAEAIEHGFAFGMPTVWEFEHADLLVDRVPGAEQVRYTCSGTEAVMTAVRLARAATGRERIVALRGAYHGFADTVIGTGGERYRRGVPRALDEQLALIDVNDVGALEAEVSANGSQTAAILVDLLPNRAGLIGVTPEFARRVRELCDEHGIVFIDDEVINLRTAPHGLAAERGVVPDLVVVGKLIGGGMPAGAVLGARSLMEEFDPARDDALEHGGTFAANPVMLRAGAEALRLLDEAAIKRLNALGEQARRDLSAAIEPYGWTVRGEGSLIRPFPPPESPDPAAEQRRVFWAAYAREVAVMPTAMMALSTPMTDEVVASAIDRVADAIRSVARSDGRGGRGVR